MSDALTNAPTKTPKTKLPAIAVMFETFSIRPNGEQVLINRVKTWAHGATVAYDETTKFVRNVATFISAEELCGEL